MAAFTTELVRPVLKCVKSFPSDPSKVNLKTVFEGYGFRHNHAELVRKQYLDQSREKIHSAEEKMEGDILRQAKAVHELI